MGWRGEERGVFKYDGNDCHRHSHFTLIFWREWESWETKNKPRESPFTFFMMLAALIRRLCPRVILGPYVLRTEKVVGLTGFVIIYVFIASFSPAQGEHNQIVNAKFTRPVNAMPMSRFNP